MAAAADQLAALAALALVIIAVLLVLLIVLGMRLRRAAKSEKVGGAPGPRGGLRPEGSDFRRAPWRSSSPPEAVPPAVERPDAAAVERPDAAAVERPDTAAPPPEYKGRTSVEWNLALAAAGWKPYWWYPRAAGDAAPAARISHEEMFPAGLTATPMRNGPGLVFHKEAHPADGPWAKGNAVELGRRLGYLYPMREIDREGLWVWWHVGRLVLWGESVPRQFDAGRLRARLEAFADAARAVDPGAAVSAEVTFPHAAERGPYYA